MIFDYSERTLHMLRRVRQFMDEHIYPREADFEEQRYGPNGELWHVPDFLDDLKAEAKRQGLWNLFLPESEYGAGLTNLEYAPLAEEMGKVMWASEIFNCNAPDTGNMEVLVRYGDEAQQEKWLKPLLNGDIRSAFVMTEPEVASSDARNISTSIIRDGDEYVINGRKWWASGVMDPRCKIWIVMGKNDPDASTYKQQSMILVEPDTPGVEVVRHLPVMGYDDSPHGHAEVVFNDVRVPAANMLLGEGRGFEIAQGRLGPGRIHHCMRTIGVAERVLELMCKRLVEREAFGQVLSDMTLWQQRVAEARIKINQARLLTLDAAHKMDTIGNKEARAEVAMIKVAAPRMAREVIDMAIQAFGGAGIAPDFGLPFFYAQIRTLSIADGPDEVHNRTVARLEFKKYM